MLYLVSSLLLMISVLSIYLSLQKGGGTPLRLLEWLSVHKRILFVISLFSFGLGTYFLTQAEGLLAGIFCSIVVWIVLASFALLFIPFATQKS